MNLKRSRKGVKLSGNKAPEGVRFYKYGNWNQDCSFIIPNGIMKESKFKKKIRNNSGILKPV